MPSFEEHRRKAESNIGFVSHLYENRLYNDWAVTGCFYAAVHIAEAALFKEERVSYRTGRDRKSQVVITPGNGQKKIEHSSDISGVIPKPTPFPHSPHAMRKLLIESNGFFGDKYAACYRNLEEMSHSSRYQCYDVNRNMVEWAVENLGVIIAVSNSREGTAFPAIKPEGK